MITMERQADYERRAKTESGGLFAIALALHGIENALLTSPVLANAISAAIERVIEVAKQERDK